jgi:hypothetical protein
MDDRITLSQEDFGTLLICALRYCSGRHTYMPSLVQGICRQHLKELRDKDISVLLDDCVRDKTIRTSTYGLSINEIDAEDWSNFEEMLKKEKARREENHNA